jgi:hypothetical protein
MSYAAFFLRGGRGVAFDFAVVHDGELLQAIEWNGSGVM